MGIALDETTLSATSQRFELRPFFVFCRILFILSQQAGVNAFKCCPAVVRIAKALPAAAAGEALASDTRQLALREVVEDNRVRKAGRHAIVVLHFLSMSS